MRRKLYKSRDQDTVVTDKHTQNLDIKLSVQKTIISEFGFVRPTIVIQRVNSVGKLTPHLHRT